jgi:hypothetical protein
MVEYTRYPWVRVYVCDACGAPAFDCRSHPVDGITPCCFMTTQPHLYKNHYKHHRASVVAQADGPHDVDAVLPPPTNHPCTTGLASHGGAPVTDPLVVGRL